MNIENGLFLANGIAGFLQPRSNFGNVRKRLQAEATQVEKSCFIDVYLKKVFEKISNRPMLIGLEINKNGLGL